MATDGHSDSYSQAKIKPSVSAAVDYPQLSDEGLFSQEPNATPKANWKKASSHSSVVPHLQDPHAPIKDKKEDINHQIIVASAKPTSVMTTLTATRARKPPVRKTTSKPASFRVYQDNAEHQRVLRGAPASTTSHLALGESITSTSGQDTRLRSIASSSKLRRPAQRLNQNSSGKCSDSRIEKSLTRSCYRAYPSSSLRETGGSYGKENKVNDANLCKKSVTRPRNSPESCRSDESRDASRHEQQPSQPRSYKSAANDFVELGSDIPENQQVFKEIILPALVNRLFDVSVNTGNGRTETTHVEIYQRLKSVYNSGWCRLLSERLHAALLQGNANGLFSMSKCERQTLYQKLTSKTRHRRMFLKFWVETYEALHLRAALKVVTHRHMVLEKDGQDTEAFIGKYLIDEEDNEAEFKAGDDDDDGEISKRKKKETGHDMSMQLYCRVVVRSILVIVILDRIAASWSSSTDTENRIKGRTRIESSAPITAQPSLFLVHSSFKSTAAALGELEKLLLVSSTQDLAKVGNGSDYQSNKLVRILQRLNCEVSYTQLPLTGFDYRVANLAVDFRDGVRFTQLVETLANCLSSLKEGDEKANKHSVIRMAKIRFPCPSRSDKLYNVQVALDLLKKQTASGSCSKHLTTLVSESHPEHIVDGYRERSIALLWAVVGEIATCGDGAFLYVAELRKEVNRLQSAIGSSPSQVRTGSTANSHEPEASLANWMACLLRLRGSSEGREGSEVYRESEHENDCARLMTIALKEYQTLIEADQSLASEDLDLRLQRLLSFDSRLCKLKYAVSHPPPLMLFSLSEFQLIPPNSITTCIYTKRPAARREYASYPISAYKRLNTHLCLSCHRPLRFKATVPDEARSSSISYPITMEVHIYQKTHHTKTVYR